MAEFLWDTMPSSTSCPTSVLRAVPCTHHSVQGTFRNFQWEKLKYEHPLLARKILAMPELTVRLATNMLKHNIIACWGITCSLESTTCILYIYIYIYTTCMLCLRSTSNYGRYLQQTRPLQMLPISFWISLKAVCIKMMRRNVENKRIYYCHCIKFHFID